MSQVQYRKICIYVLVTPDEALGCRKSNCTYSHAPSEHQGAPGAYKGLFEESCFSSTLAYKAFVQYLELRNANRKGVLILTRTQQNIPKYHKAFEPVLKFQLSIFQEKARCDRERIARLHKIHREKEELKRKEIERDKLEERMCIKEEKLRSEEQRRIINQTRRAINLVREAERQRKAEDEYIRQLQKKKKTCVDSKVHFTEEKLASIRKEQDAQEERTVLLRKLQEIDSIIRKEQTEQQLIQSKLEQIDQREIEITKEIERIDFQDIDLSDFDIMCNNILTQAEILLRSESINEWLVTSIEVCTSPIISEDRISSGGYGTVYRTVRCDHKGKFVTFAEKLDIQTNVEYGTSNEFQNRKLLGPPVLEGIVTHVSYWSNRLVMRYYNHTLYSLASALPQTEKVMLMPTILIQLCKGLKHMNDLDYFHNDIKPDNILVNYEKGRVEAVLGDIGGMKKRGVKSTTTYLYRAPEHDQGIYYSSRSDVYSLGLSILEFLDNSVNNYRDHPYTVPMYPFRELLISMISEDFSKRPYPHQIIEELSK